MTDIVKYLDKNLGDGNLEKPRDFSFLTTALKYFLLTLVGFIIASPILIAILGSFRTTGEISARPFGLPTEGIEWNNYRTILESDELWISLKNSLIITIASTAICITFSSLLAYVFARIQFFGRGILFNILTLGLLFPLVVVILPMFIRIRDLNLIDSYWGVILPLVAFGLPANTIILRGFFRSIPVELEEAAYIDGCTVIGFFRLILIPMSRPSLAAVTVLQLINSWNDYYIALLVLSNSNKWPLQLGLMRFQGQYSSDLGLIMTYITLLMIPAILFYVFAERFIVTGLTGGELKG